MKSWADGLSCHHSSADALEWASFIIASLSGGGGAVELCVSLDIDESRRRTIDGVAVVSADDVADALRSSWESGTSICEAA